LGSGLAANVAALALPLYQPEGGVPRRPLLPACVGFVELAPPSGSGAPIASLGGSWNLSPIPLTLIPLTLAPAVRPAGSVVPLGLWFGGLRFFAFFLEPNERDHHFGLHLDAGLLHFGGGFKDGAGLHLGDFAIDDAETATAETEHRVELVEFIDALFDLRDGHAHFLGQGLLRPAGKSLRWAGKLAMFLAMNKTVNVAEFKDRFSELLALVEQGGEVIVCRRNVPLARVEPIRKLVPRKAQRGVVGCMKGTVRIHGDLADPCIPEADWEMMK
jgi:prevent-host-death family protein